jgi:hypothetical protein
LRPCQRTVHAQYIGPVLPHCIQIGAFLRVRAAGGHDRQSATDKIVGQCLPALLVPLLVAEERRRMQNRIILRGNGKVRRKRRDDLVTRLDTQRAGEQQCFLDPVQLGIHRCAPMHEHRLEFSDRAIFGRGCAMAACGDGKEGGPVAGLRRYRKVVASPEPADEGQAFHGRWPLRADDDGIDVGVTGKDRCRVGEHHDVKYGVRPGSAQTADQRCREQYIAQAPHCDHEDPRFAREIKTRGHGPTSREMPAFRVRRSRAVL